MLLSSHPPAWSPPSSSVILLLPFSWLFSLLASSCFFFLPYSYCIVLRACLYVHRYHVAVRLCLGWLALLGMVLTLSTRPPSFSNQGPSLPMPLVSYQDVCSQVCHYFLLRLFANSWLPSACLVEDVFPLHAFDHVADGNNSFMFMFAALSRFTCGEVVCTLKLSTN